MAVLCHHDPGHGAPGPLSSAKVRGFYQDLQRTTPSRCLAEIPEDILQRSSPERPAVPTDR